MRVLLDENLPRRLKRRLPAGVEAVTVQERGWAGKKNGELLRDAASEFDCFLTTDRGIEHQQNLQELDLRVVLLRARSNRMVDLEPLIPAIHEALGLVHPGSVTHVGGELPG